MNETVSILLTVFGAFFIGCAVPIWLMRGFFWPYITTKKNGILLKVFLKRGGFRFTAGKFKGGLVEYKLFREKHVCVMEPSAVQRGLRNSWMDVPEGDTAPFVHQKHTVDYEEREFEEHEPVMSPLNDQEQLIDKKTKKPIFKKITVKREVPVRRLFLGWDDSQHIANALLLAAQKPKITFSSAMGGLNFKTILIVLIAIAGIIYLMQGGVLGGQ